MAGIFGKAEASMKVKVAGTGMTKFGELWGEGAETLAFKAADEALKEAELKIDQIDLLVVGNKLLQQLEGRAHVGALMAEVFGFKGPAIHVEAACASGGVAVRQGLMAIRSGMVKRVLVVGVEKMTDASSEEISRALMSAAGEEEQWAGATFPSLYGMMARSYLKKYDLKEEVLAWPAVKNHEHGKLNPLAHFRNGVSLKMANQSGLIADPIRQLHCSPISDGAAAVVLEAGKTDEGVVLAGSGQSGERLSLAGRKEWTSIPATEVAAKQAMKEAGVTIEEVDLMEVHDCFSIAELMAYEDLGLAKKGKAGKAIEAGVGWLGKGGVVVNSSGGLKACGHPVGATGVKQVVEVARQLRGGLGKRQVKEARVGLTQNVGGSGGTVVVHVLRTAKSKKQKVKSKEPRAKRRTVSQEVK